MVINEMIWTRGLAGCLMQLVANTKVNLSQPQSPQVVSNQGNYSVVKQPLSFYHVCLYIMSVVTSNSCTMAF